MQDREPKQVEIPAHWQFRERNDPGLDVLLCEPELGLLYFDVGPGKNSINNVIGGAYIFDRWGKPTHALTIRENFALEVFVGGELSAEFILHMPENKNTYNLIAHAGERLPEKPSVDWYATLATAHYKGRRDKEGESWGEVEFVSLSTIFDKDREGKTIFAPPISLFPNTKVGAPSQGLKAQDWRTYGIDSQYRAFKLEAETPTSVLVTHKRSKNNYRVSWEVEEGVLTVTQHHLGTDTKKTVSTPLSVNVTRLIEAAFFPTEELRRLIAEHGQGTEIPWKTLNHLVGFRVGYVYPPPSSKKNTDDLNYKPGIV